MASVKYNVLTLPQSDELVDSRGFLTRSWFTVMANIADVVNAFGTEKYFTFQNNVTSPEDVTGLSLTPEKESLKIVEFLIQRVTTGVGATELIEAGIMLLVYRPSSNSCEIHQLGSGPDDAGIDFTITATGQVQYESTNMSGTPSIDRITWRPRTLSGKYHSYSKVGR